MLLQIEVFVVVVNLSVPVQNEVLTLSVLVQMQKD